MAHVKWQGVWCMPMYDEWNELIEKCDWEWTKQKNISGYKVKSKTNSNSIFLPTAGRILGKNSSEVGFAGHYWASSFDDTNPHLAWHITFSSSEGIHMYLDVRTYGYAVRPVCPIPTLTLSVADCIDEQKNEYRCDVGQSITITANPKAGHHFCQWPDGNKDNPRTIILTKDTTLIAKFAEGI